MERDDTCGFFVFDYSAMETSYGAQACTAIYDSLRTSSGVCAFHDGDIFSCETVRQLAKQANLVEPSHSHSPLAELTGSWAFGAYLAAMWTDAYRNFGILHDALVAASFPGYLGYMTLQGRREGDAVLQLFVRQLHLPASIALRDGTIIKGTSKYGIGVRLADHALVRAAELGQLEDVRKAIADGADVNCIDPMDRCATPLVHAASSGHTPIVRVLLASGADPNARNMGSNTALMLASRFGHIEVVKALIAGGADVNAKDRSGGTALDNASDHLDIQAALRAAGARE